MERILTYGDAIHEATDLEMDRDPSVVAFGIGVDDHRAFYGTLKGLADKYGDARIFGTPLAEDSMTGLAIGAALGGLRPIQIHERMDFVLLAMNQLVNIAAKSRYMYGGAVFVPLVVRACIGRSWGQGAQHSQALHSFFMHVPGLKVVAPTTPYDAKGCLTAAIRDDNPVIYMEHRLLHRYKGHVPAEPYTVPFGKARILAEGADATIVGISFMGVECLRARNYLETVGINAEVIDPVSLSPLDMETILKSVRKTGRLLVVDNGWTCCGAGAEIVAQVAERLDGEHHIRVRRMGFAPVPCQTVKNLEQLFYPNARTIAEVAYSVVHKNKKQWKPEGAEAPEITEFKGPF